MATRTVRLYGTGRYGEGLYGVGTAFNYPSLFADKRYNRDNRRDLFFSPKKPS